MRYHVAKPTIATVALLLFAFAALPLRSVGDATTREGCMNQWLFNGIWRVRATKVEPLMDGSQQVGWQVTEAWRNGTTQEMAPSDSLLKDQALELADGSSITASSNNTGGMSMGLVAYHQIAPSAQFLYVQKFRAAALNRDVQPKGLTITFDGARLAQFKGKPHFTTSDYNYRIKLDCQASGAQAAQGGSFEIAATQGCMNQWMSNGVWRMRATAIAPANDLGGAQVGWKIAEEWSSLAHQPVAPGDTNITDQQLVLTSGNTISSSSGVVSSGSFAQLAGHTFAPGSSFTYQQEFRNIPFDVSDKPAKVIVTFDAAKEKLAAKKPQYKAIPPNFRIGLTCSK